MSGGALPVPRLVLASRSPRRAELLRRMGFRFEVRAADVPEDAAEDADPRETVCALSERKAEAVLPGLESGWVVGADTVVALDGRMLGKPQDADEAADMLRRLSGRTHEVFTGFSLIGADGGRRSGAERTAVTFRVLEDWEIAMYVATGGPLDKAGAYGIQDRSGLFVDRIEGCFYNVVGFPLTAFYGALRTLAGPDAVRGLLSSPRDPDSGGGPV